MTNSPPTFRQRLGRRVLTGVAVMVPFFITMWILVLLFRMTAGVMSPLVRHLWPGIPEILVSLIAICMLIVLIYIVGTVAAWVGGRRAIAWGEALLTQVPVVKTVYSAAKQVVDAFSFMREKPQTQRPVLVDFPRPGMWSVGFLTNTLTDAQGNKMCTVFMPTTPNPTSGFLLIVPASDVRELDIGFEDAIKMIMSGGVLAPSMIDVERRLG